MHGLLTVMSSLVVETRLSEAMWASAWDQQWQHAGSVHTGFSSCGTQPWLLYGMQDLPGPETESLSPALAEFLSTVPLRKSTLTSFLKVILLLL